MGCNNCSTSVQQQSSLPLGCTAIQDIQTVTSDTQVIVTITLCDGSIRQFSIPIPSNGNDGDDGNDGQNGVSITEVISSQNGPDITLVFTFSDGTTTSVTFTIPLFQLGAYIIEHQTNQTGPIYQNTALPPNTILWSSVVPPNTLNQPGDSVFFELEWLMKSNNGNNAALSDFKILYGNTSSFNLGQVIQNLPIDTGSTGGNCLLKLTGTITLRSILPLDPLNPQLQVTHDFVGQIQFFNPRVATIKTSHPEGTSTNCQLLAGQGVESFLVYNMGINEINPGQENFIRISGGSSNSIIDFANPIYSISKKIPKL
jgi:hypothetical protein